MKPCVSDNPELQQDELAKERVVNVLEALGKNNNWAVFLQDQQKQEPPCQGAKISTPLQIHLNRS